MTDPVPPTKLFVPRRRPRSVARTRLLERLSDGRRVGHSLTLLSAPAGFGKTSLLSAWIDAVREAEPDVQVAWVSLDDGDDDSARLLRSLQVSLGHPPEDGPPAAIIGTLIGAIQRSSRPTVLVLDDFQAIGSVPVRDVVAPLLEHQPPDLHVVIASRSDPLLPLGRLRGGGLLTELRATDLRFTADEATDFLNRVMGLALTDEEVAALDARTEGWAAGLQLAALSLRDRSDPGTFITAFTGSNRFVIDYLAEEVLNRLPDERRTFLLDSAFLSRMTASLCDAITGRTDGQEMLESLERDNLFLVPLDDERAWYRFHHLFADVLRSRSRHEHGPRAAELQRLASVWHETHGHTEDAVDYALAAADFDRAAHLIERALPDMRRERQDTILLSWLQRLPEETARRMPVLRTFSAWSMFVAGDLAGADSRLEEIEDTLRSSEGHGSAPGEELTKLPVTIAAYRAALAQARGDLRGTELHARRALALSPADDYRGRGSGGGMLALALWGQGDVGSAVPTFRDAMASLQTAGYLTDAISGTVVMADMLAVQGRRIAAAEAFEHAAGLAAAAGHGWTVDLHPGRSELLLEEGDVEGATALLTAAAPAGAHPGLPENRYRWFVAMARVREAEGDLDAALGLLDQAERLQLPGFFPSTRPIPAMRARLWITQGRLRDAATWADEHALSADDDADYLHEFEHLTLVRLHLARFAVTARLAELDDAERLLGTLLSTAEAGGRGGSLLEILVLQALLLHSRGRLLDAMAPLRRALVLAEPEGYVRLFAEEGPAMAALLDEAGRRAIRPEYVRRLRRTYAVVRPDGDRPTEPLSERELTVLGLLMTELTGPQIAAELFISLNTLRSHTKHIFDKLGVNGRPAAVRRAQELGLI